MHKGAMALQLEGLQHAQHIAQQNADSYLQHMMAYRNASAATIPGMAQAANLSGREDEMRVDSDNVTNNYHIPPNPVDTRSITDAIRQMAGQQKQSILPKLLDAGVKIGVATLLTGGIGGVVMTGLTMAPSIIKAIFPEQQVVQKHVEAPRQPKQPKPTTNINTTVFDPTMWDFFIGKPGDSRDPK